MLQVKYIKKAIHRQNGAADANQSNAKSQQQHPNVVPKVESREVKVYTYFTFTSEVRWRGCFR